jgi:hypothetical protein
MCFPKRTVFWYLMLFNLEIARCFVGTYYHRLHGRWVSLSRKRQIPAWTEVFDIEDVGHTFFRNVGMSPNCALLIPKYRIIRSYRRENPKSKRIFLFLRTTPSEMWHSLPSLLCCDGFVQSIKLWGQKNQLLGKHVQTNTRRTIQVLCFLCVSRRDIC